MLSRLKDLGVLHSSIAWLAILHDRFDKRIAIAIIFEPAAVNHWRRQFRWRETDRNCEPGAYDHGISATAHWLTNYFAERPERAQTPADWPESSGAIVTMRISRTIAPIQNAVFLFET